MKNIHITSLMAIIAATALTANVAIAHEGGKVGEGNLGSAGGHLSLIHISEPTRPTATSRMPSSA